MSCATRTPDDDRTKRSNRSSHIAVLAAEVDSLEHDTEVLRERRFLGDPDGASFEHYRHDRMAAVPKEVSFDQSSALQRSLDFNAFSCGALERSPR